MTSKRLELPACNINVSSSRIKSRVGYFKILNVILGVIVMGIGLHSYLESTWQQGAYTICDEKLPYRIKNCPHISLERYYAGVVIATFLLSIFAIFATMMFDMTKGNFKMIDLTYQCLAALLLLIGGIVYIVSAEKIYKRFGDDKSYKRTEKLVAAAFTILQSLVSGITAVLIWKS